MSSPSTKNILTFEQKAQILTSDAYDSAAHRNSIAPPIYQTVMFDLKTGAERDQSYIYTSLGNPNFSIVEKKMAAVECGAAAKLFSTGMAAIHAVVFSLVGQGDHVIVSENVYVGVKTLFQQTVKRFGVSVTWVSGKADEIEAALRPNTKLIYLESPGSMLFDIIDLATIGQIGKRHGAKLAIDNTWATPLYQNPLCYGFDVVIHSATKYLSGHNDVMGGVVIGSKKLVRQLVSMGAVMDPHQAWLLGRSLVTLPVRMKQGAENAMTIARFLEAHPKVERILYPGLPTHPEYTLGKRQMTGYSSLMSFIAKGSYEQTMNVLNRFKLIKPAWSYGGAMSLAMPGGKDLREQLIRRGYGQNLIRLYVGLENPSSLMEDLDDALQVIAQ